MITRLAPPGLDRRKGGVDSGRSRSARGRAIFRRIATGAGFEASALPIASICCCPPESAAPGLLRRSRSTGKVHRRDPAHASTGEGLVHAPIARFSSTRQRWKDPSALGRHRYAHSNDSVRQQDPRSALHRGEQIPASHEAVPRFVRNRVVFPAPFGSNNCDGFPTQRP